MSPNDVLQMLRNRPFEPFRIHMSDGSEYVISHPELALVERNKVVVGVPGRRGPDGPLLRTVFLALSHVTRTEPVNGAAPKKPRRPRKR